MKAQHTIDLCLMSDSGIIRAAEMDVKRALDRGGTGKFDDYGEEESIESGVAYAKKCLEELGPIPFFPEIGEGDYATYSCLDSTPIPMTVTDAEGNVTYPSTKQPACDNRSLSTTHFEPNAVAGQTNGPRVASRTGEQGTALLLLCRKALDEEGMCNDVAMIGHNPYVGPAKRPVSPHGWKSCAAPGR